MWSPLLKVISHWQRGGSRLEMSTVSRLPLTWSCQDVPLSTLLQLILGYRLGMKWKSGWMVALNSCTWMYCHTHTLTHIHTHTPRQTEVGWQLVPSQNSFFTLSRAVPVSLLKTGPWAVKVFSMTESGWSWASITLSSVRNRKLSCVLFSHLLISKERRWSSELMVMALWSCHWKLTHSNLLHQHPGQLHWSGCVVIGKYIHAV